MFTVSDEDDDGGDDDHGDHDQSVVVVNNSKRVLNYAVNILYFTSTFPLYK